MVGDGAVEGFKANLGCAGGGAGDDCTHRRMAPHHPRSPSSTPGGQARGGDGGREGAGGGGRARAAASARGRAGECRCTSGPTAPRLSSGACTPCPGGPPLPSQHVPTKAALLARPPPPLLPLLCSNPRLSRSSPGPAAPQAFSVERSCNGATLELLEAARGRYKGCAKARAAHEGALARVLSAFDQAMHLCRILAALELSGHAAALAVVAEVRGRRPRGAHAAPAALQVAGGRGGAPCWVAREPRAAAPRRRALTAQSTPPPAPAGAQRQVQGAAGPGGGARLPAHGRAPAGMRGLSRAAAPASARFRARPRPERILVLPPLPHAPAQPHRRAPQREPTLAPSPSPQTGHQRREAPKDARARARAHGALPRV